MMASAFVAKFIVVVKKTLLWYGNVEKLKNKLRYAQICRF